MEKEERILGFDSSRNLIEMLITKLLKRKIVGQERAIDETCNSLQRVFAGLKNNEKPLGVFFFAGPSRVGKTETAIALADILKPHRFARYKKIVQYVDKDGQIFDDEKEFNDFPNHLPGLIKIDCESLKEKWNVTSLTSSSPGYIGSDKPALLNPAHINGNWATIILFDEIEKAHPAVYDVLLQILDGKLKLINAKGEIDFTQSMIIMTSNIGSKNIEDQIKGKQMGFRHWIGDKDEFTKQASNEIYKICKAEYEEIFPREFRNRVDRMIVFRYLGENSLSKIFDLEMIKLYERILNCGKIFDVVVKENVKKMILAENDFTEQAAGIIRLIDRKIINPLSAFLMQDDIKTGDEVLIYLNKQKRITFKIAKSVEKSSEKELIKKIKDMTADSDNSF